MEIFANTPLYEVVRGPQDGWSVRLVGDEEASSWHETEAEAVEAARIKSAEPSEVEVHADIVAPLPPESEGVTATFVHLIGAWALILAMVIGLALIAS